MKKFGIIFSLTILSTIHLLAQEQPFASFEKAVRAQSGGFAGNKEVLSKVFQEDRIRLGETFESSLWEYLGTDADKHFWISSFLTSESYLHGYPPLSELSSKIRVRALELLNDRNDKSSIGRKVTLNRKLAMSSKLAGNQPAAVAFRDRAEGLLAKYSDISPYISGQTNYERCILAAIQSSISHCSKNEQEPAEKIINAGWMNSRARNFSQPTFPVDRKDRSRARVDVRITTDVAGNVTSAAVIRGPADLHELALESAKKLTFPPTELSGVPAKVSGWISYDFKP